MKAHRTPALLFLVPRLSEPQPETMRSARSVFFGKTNRFDQATGRPIDDDDADALWQRHDELGSSSGWQLQDLNSSNGTFLDKEPLPRGGLSNVDDGSLIGIGPDVKMKFLVPRTLYRFLASYRETTLNT